MSLLTSIVSCVSLHVVVVYCLATRRSALQSPRPFPRWRLVAIQCLGASAALFTLAIPYINELNNPLQQCGLRVVCFFYACKLCDLAICKARDPPVLLQEDGQTDTLAPMLTSWDRATYVWLLLTQMRYRSFDIAVVQKGRLSATDGKRSDLVHTLVPLLAIPALAYSFQTPATRCILLLLLIQHALEAVHLVLHPFCPNWLFYRPFSATSISSFWTTHWHAAAAPFLQSLAYQPGKRIGGRWLGVLFAFSLSGVWHGWAASVLVDPRYGFWLGFQVLLLFVGWGVGCLIESVITGKGGVLWWVVVWVYSASVAGWCFRTLECHSRIPWLRVHGYRG